MLEKYLTTPKVGMTRRALRTPFQSSDLFVKKQKQIRTFELFVVLTNFFESNKKIEVKISYFNLEYKVLRH